MLVKQVVDLGFQCPRIRQNPAIGRIDHEVVLLALARDKAVRGPKGRQAKTRLSIIQAIRKLGRNGAAGLLVLDGFGGCARVYFRRTEAQTNCLESAA